jgi:hypothetical protein
MDLYTSIASIIAFVVVAIIIWLIGPRPPEATRRLRGSSGKAARQHAVRRSVVSANTNSTGPKRWFHMRPYPLRGLSFMVDFKIPVKPLVVVRPPAALQGSGTTSTPARNVMF